MSEPLSPGKFVVPFLTIFKFVEAIAAIVPESRWHFKDGALYSLAVNSENTAIVECILGLPEFKGSAILGIDISAMRETFDFVSKVYPEPGFNPPVLISWSPSGNSAMPYDLKIVIPGILQFTTKTYEDSSVRKDPKLPTVKLNSGFECPGERLWGAVRFCVLTSDKCRVMIEGRDETTLSTVDGDRNNVRIPLADNGKNAAKADFSIDYLRRMTKVLKGSHIFVKFSDDNPISLSEDLGSGLSVRYFLATRIEAD